MVMSEKYLLGFSGFLGALSQEESIYTLHAISKHVTQECKLAGDPLQLPISDASAWTEILSNDAKHAGARKDCVKATPVSRGALLYPCWRGRKWQP